MLGKYFTSGPNPPGPLICQNRPYWVRSTGKYEVRWDSSLTSQLVQYHTVSNYVTIIITPTHPNMQFPLIPLFLWKIRKHFSHSAPFTFLSLFILCSSLPEFQFRRLSLALLYISKTEHMHTHKSWYNRVQLALAGWGGGDIFSKPRWYTHIRNETFTNCLWTKLKRGGGGGYGRFLKLHFLKFS